MAVRGSPCLVRSYASASIALGLVMIVSADATLPVLAGFVVLGMSNGLATLARATVLAERYGSGAYGTIAGVAASVTPPRAAWDQSARHSPRHFWAPAGCCGRSRCWPASPPCSPIGPALDPAARAHLARNVPFIPAAACPFTVQT
jgi:hypothetical protein